MNRFLICAPYQMLGALELIDQLRFADNHLSVIDTGHFTRAQYDSVIDVSRWKSVQFHDFRYRLVERDFRALPPQGAWEHAQELFMTFDQILKRRRAERLARTIGVVDNLVLGNYRREYDRHMRHIANRVSSRRIYLLDVGTDTLRIAHDRRLDAAGIEPAANALPAGGSRQRLRRRLKDWDTRGAASVTFFTTYDVDPGPADEVIRNQFSLVRSLAPGKPTDRVLFAGQPLLDQRYVDRGTFAGLLDRVRRHFADRRLAYVAHPRESELQLGLVRAAGIAVERNLAPFEYAIAFGGERPGCVASFFSSVLENSAAMFGRALAIKAFLIPDEFLLKDRESVASVYAHFSASAGAIEVVRDY